MGFTRFVDQQLPLRMMPMLLLLRLKHMVCSIVMRYGHTFLTTLYRLFRSLLHFNALLITYSNVVGVWAILICSFNLVCEILWAF